MSFDRPRRAAVLATALAALIGLTGCLVENESKRPGRSSARVSLAKNGRNDTYVAVRALKRQPANAFLLFERDLRPPFRIETVVGIFSARRARGIVDQAQFGLELDPPDPVFPLTQFYGISVVPQTAQTIVRSYSRGVGRAATIHVETPFSADTLLFDLALEHDGTDMHFFARAHGAETWLDFGQVDATPDPFPVRPSLGLFGAQRPGAIGYDDFRIVANGPRPGGLSAEATLVEDIWEVLDGVTSAAHLLDGDDPDPQGARDALAIHTDEHGRIIDALEALVAKRRRPRIGPAAAAAKMRASKRSFDSAVRQLDVLMSRLGKRRTTPQSAARLLRRSASTGYAAIVALRRGLEQE